MKLPLEIRKKIYGCFVDELRGAAKGGAPQRRTVSSEGGPPQRSGHNSLHLYVFDKSFDPCNQDDNVAHEPMLVEGLPDQRNLDPRAGADTTKPMDALEIYKSIQSGELDENDPNFPSAWKDIRRREERFKLPWEDEEPEATMSDAEDSDATDWDSDEAEIAENLKRNVKPLVERDGSKVAKVKPVVTKSPKKKGKEVEVIEIVDSDEEKEVVLIEDSEESDDDDYDPQDDEDSFEDIDDDSDDSTYQGGDDKVKYLGKVTKSRPVPDTKRWIPRCYVVIYSRYLTSPDCAAHRVDDPDGLDYEDLWACDVCSHRDPAAYDNLRRLAQVSPLMTIELGKALWLGATAEFDGPETFLALAVERPAVLPCIRHVVLNLEINPILPLGRSGTANLASMLGLVSEKMDLDSFKVQLDTRDSNSFYVDTNPEPDWGTESRKEWAPLFRALRTRRFLLSTVDIWQPRGIEGEQPGQLEEVLDAWFTSLLAQWMPDCLREEKGMKGKELATASLIIPLRLRNSSGRPSQ